MHRVNAGLGSVEMKASWAKRANPVITANWPCCLLEGPSQFDTLEDRFPTALCYTERGTFPCPTALGPVHTLHFFLYLLCSSFSGSVIMTGPCYCWEVVLFDHSESDDRLLVRQASVWHHQTRATEASMWGHALHFFRRNRTFCVVCDGRRTGLYMKCSCSSVKCIFNLFCIFTVLQFSLVQPVGSRQLYLFLWVRSDCPLRLINSFNFHFLCLRLCVRSYIKHLKSAPFRY